MPQFSKGDSFLAPNPYNDDLHLTVVLSNPTGNPPSIITVSMTTATSLTDSTVVLQKGDHEFIKWATSVEYGYLRAIDCATLHQLEAMTSRIVRQPKMRAVVLERVIMGVFKSERPSKGIVKRFKEILEAESKVD